MSESSEGVLYVVATPIGNLDDLSPRAARVLGEVDLIAAEDTRHSARLLRHLGLESRFAALLGGDSLAVRKPDPSPLHAAVTALGGGPALLVGDSEVDAETAERAGLPFVLFTRGYRHTPVDGIPHAAAFDDFAALPGIVARLSRGA